MISSVVGGRSVKVVKEQRGRVKFFNMEAQWNGVLDGSG